LLVAAAGYLIDIVLKPYFFPRADTRVLMIAYIGELYFMGWLLVRGSRIRDPEGAAV
jgi:hypothetical protein